MQRRLLITRILSSPLLFCASSSSSPKPSSEQARLQSLTPPSDDDDDTEDAPNSLEISTTETEEYDCPSLNGSAALEPNRPRPLNPAVVGGASRVVAVAAAADDDDDYDDDDDKRCAAADDEGRLMGILRGPRKLRSSSSSNYNRDETSLGSDDRSLHISVTKVLDDIIERISAVSDYAAENASQDTDSIESGKYIIDHHDNT